MAGSFPLALTFDDVLLQPAFSDFLPTAAETNVTLGSVELGIPLLSAAMDTVTGSRMAIALGRLGGLGVLHKNQTPEEQAREVERVKATDNAAAAAVGVGADLTLRADALVYAGVDLLVVDTAHGDSLGVVRAVEVLRERAPDVVLVAGNVATAEGARRLEEAGADAVKVGVGPGSICTTRIVAGVGVPQLSAILSCCDAVSVPIIADGGIRHPGDVTKAIAAGAHAVMVGSLLGACEEAPGERVTINGETRKLYRGMGSASAMRAGSRDRYGQEHVKDERKLVPEGVEASVRAQGPVGDVVHQLIGGLRAGMGYTGCQTLAKLRSYRGFVRQTNAGLRESHVHDVIPER